MAKSTHAAPNQAKTNVCMQTLIEPGPIQHLDSHCAGYLLVVDDEVRVALVVVKDDIDLWVNPVVHTGVIKVTGGVAGVDRWRSPHGGISYSKPVHRKQRQKQDQIQSVWSV